MELPVQFEGRCDKMEFAVPFEGRCDIAPEFDMALPPIVNPALPDQVQALLVRVAADRDAWF